MAQKFLRDGRWVSKDEVLRMNNKKKEISIMEDLEVMKAEKAEEIKAKKKSEVELEKLKKSEEEKVLDAQMEEEIIDEIADVKEEEEVKKLNLDRIENLEKELRILPLDQLRSVAKDQGVKASWVKGKEKLIKGILELNK